MSSIAASTYCAAKDTSGARVLRMVAAACIVLIGVTAAVFGAIATARNVGPAVLAADALFLCAGCLVLIAGFGLLRSRPAAAAWAQGGAIAGLVSSFFARLGNPGAGFDPSLTVAGLLVLVVIVAAWLRRDREQSACKCGA